MKNYKYITVGSQSDEQFQFIRRNNQKNMYRKSQKWSQLSNKTIIRLKKKSITSNLRQAIGINRFDSP